MRRAVAQPLGRPLLHTPSVPLPELDPTAEAVVRCRDVGAALGDRLEALEDVMESEVGDTPLLRARGLERRFGVRQLYLKLEGDNPTGTQKDRIAFAQVYDALRRGFEEVVLATCGNYGVAMAWAARVPGLRCIAVVPERYHAPRLAQIEQLGAEVVRKGDDYEGAVEHARELAERTDAYDANPGGANEPIQVGAYKQIAAEIFDELRDAPAAIAAPVSNGTTLVGIYRGFVSLHRRGRSSRLPRCVAGSAYRKNPIARSWRLGLPSCEDLRPDAVTESSVNEPLINWHAIDGDAALEAVRGSNGSALDVRDKRMREVARLIRVDQGIEVQPASTAGLCALLALHETAPLPPDRYVAILTGRSA